MLINAQDYLGLVKEGKEPFKFPKVVCGECKAELDFLDKEGNYKIGEKQVCQACFFGALGEEIEKHPIGHPVPHGGCHGLD